jgi:hypothetical protein
VTAMEKAKGGAIRGPGSRDSDIVTVPPSGGFVIPASAVRRYGAALLDEVDRRERPE